LQAIAPHSPAGGSIHLLDRFPLPPSDSHDSVARSTQRAGRRRFPFSLRINRPFAATAGPAQGFRVYCRPLAPGGRAGAPQG